MNSRTGTTGHQRVADPVDQPERDEDHGRVRPRRRQQRPTPAGDATSGPPRSAPRDRCCQAWAPQPTGDDVGRRRVDSSSHATRSAGFDDLRISLTVPGSPFGRSAPPRKSIARSMVATGGRVGKVNPDRATWPFAHLDPGGLRTVRRRQPSRTGPLTECGRLCPIHRLSRMMAAQPVDDWRPWTGPGDGVEAGDAGARRAPGGRRRGQVGVRGVCER